MSRSGSAAVELVSAGIDWLTMTMKPEDDKTDYWYLRGVHCVGQVSRQGYDLKERSLLGYSGLSAGNCFVGSRPDSNMFQFTGYHADTAFAELYNEHANVPRIDLQVTVKYKIMPQDVARKAYEDADTKARGQSGSTNRKFYIIMGNDGGDTFYMGSPSSSQRGRLYNKEVQSEDPLYARMWRYETVYRNDRAKVVAAVIGRSTGDRASTVRNIVSNWWEQRGVDCSHFSSGERDPVPIYRTLPTDIERKLRWIRNQVRPTIKTLLDQGLIEELSEALDIDLGEGVNRH